MATFNLARNSRVFFTTNVAANTGIVATSGFTAANSQELTVLDGFSFSQTTNADVITVSEAGSAPARGQRSFNTSLNPVDFSFSTYIRPYLSSALVKAEEACLWNALFGDTAIGATAAVVTTGTNVTSATYTAPTATTSPRITLTGTAFTTTTGTTPTSTALVVNEIVTIKGADDINASSVNAPVRVVSANATTIVLDYLMEPADAPITDNFDGKIISFVRTSWIENAAVAADTDVPAAYSEVNLGRSNKNQLLPFGLVMTVDNLTYALDNCVMDQATIDFGLDGIATVQWTGKATSMTQVATNATYSTAGNPVLGGGLTGTITGKASSASVKYITNKLSTVSLKAAIGGGGSAYNLALTGGNLTIANNVTYVTPANIGVVNKPVTYFTGTRSITGSLNAYLRSGTLNSGALLAQMLSDADDTTEPKFQLNIAIGGASNAVRAEAFINGASLQIPTIDSQAILSTTINFTAQGIDDRTADQLYDLELPNEMRIRYFGT